MLEKQLEKLCCEHSKTKGMISYKFTSTSANGVPDRLFITNRGTVFFVEFKSKGNLPKPVQLLQIERIKNQGTDVYVIDSYSDFCDVIVKYE